MANDLHEQGVAAYKAGDYQLSEKLIRSAVNLDDKNPSFYINLGSALIASRRYSPALMSLSRAIDLDPKISVAHYLMGLVMQEMGNAAAALESTNKSLALQPNFASALILRGNLLSKLGNAQLAIADYTAAIHLNSDDALAYFNLANALRSQGRMAEALTAFDQALKLEPNFVQALCNKANTERDLMQISEAEITYKLAIQLEPANHQLLWNLSLLQLQLGNYKEGWKNYENRLLDPLLPSIKTDAIAWHKHLNLQGKTILVICEQGLGDMIQFARYVTCLHHKGAEVTLQVPDVLVDLMKSLDGVQSVISLQSDLPKTDFYCMLMSLPFELGTELNTIPFNSVPYLNPTQKSTNKWQKLLPKTQSPRIGLVVRGNPKNPRDQQRSIRLSDLVKFLPPQAHYVLLQDRIDQEDAATLHQYPHIYSIHDEISSFDDTAAACSQMDWIITVDTAVAHLSGALGVPAWVIIPFASDWRWLIDRTDTPWYSKSRLFRQSKSHEWTEVFCDLSKALNASLLSN